MTLLGQFIAFVNQQAPEKEINNSYGWERCAVGEFADSIKHPLPKALAAELAHDTGSIKRIGWVFSDDIKITKEKTLMDRLNCSEFTTYGELQEYLLTSKLKSVEVFYE